MRRCTPTSQRRACIVGREAIGSCYRCCCAATHFGLRTIDRWKLFDNLRRSLVAPFTVALLVCSFFGRLRADVRRVRAGRGARSAADRCSARWPASRRVATIWRCAISIVRHSPTSAAPSAAHCGCIAQLLQQAMLLLDAIVRALYRSVVSHRRLLQWTTAAAAQAAAHRDLVGIARHHMRVTLVAAAAAGAARF